MAIQTRKIIHVDMDAFYASVEQRDNHALQGKPVAVGSPASERGVVVAASYEARKYGIHSAMPSRTAARLCPDLIFVPARFAIYRAVSQEIREIFQRFTDLVEPLSLDEAYLDVTANKVNEASATIIARQIKSLIVENTKLTASAGVSINKFLAKMASGMNKPDGLFVIAPHLAEAFVERLAIEKFHGIGQVTAQKMHALGVRTGADLKTWQEADLLKTFGKVGSFYFHIARGRDDREVEANRARKSIGAEESFRDDLVESEQAWQALSLIADTLTERMIEAKTKGRTLTLKVKYADYSQITRSRTVFDTIAGKEEILTIAKQLLPVNDVEVKHVRLLGLSLSNLDSQEEQKEYVQLTVALEGLSQYRKTY
jgi:DNA polymerase-4